MTRGSRRVLGVAAALALGVLAAVPGLLSSACGGGLSRAAFEERFAENDADRLRAVLDKLGAPSPAKVPANATGRPVVVGITETSPRKLIAFDVQAGRKLWEAAVAAQTRPSIAGDVAVVLSGHDVVAVGLADGRTRFRFGDEGLSYLGAAFADGTVALVLGSNVPQNAPVTVERKSIVVAVDLASGAVRWRAEVPREIGAPAAAGGLFFFPWDRQYLTAVEPRTGREVARVRTTDDIFSFVWAGPEGVVYGANNLYRLSTKSVGGTKADTPHYALPLKGLPREPRLSPDAYAQPTVEFSARERIRLHWGAAAGAVADRVTLADDTLYFLFYRYLFAYAAGDGRLRWVHKAPRDIVTLGIGRGGVVLVGEEGDVAFVDSDAGTVVGRQSMGVRLVGASVDVAGFRLEGETPRPQKSLRERLVDVALDNDNRLVPARQYAVRLLGELPDDDATRDLLTIASSREAPEALKNEAGRVLSTRRNGAPLLLAALSRHYGFLEGTAAPPLGPIARAMTEARERRAVPVLVEHLRDHETEAGALPDLVSAIVALGDASVLPALREFLVRYHADTEIDMQTRALEQAAEGLVRLGGSEERALLRRLADDPYTIGSLKRRVQAVLAAPPSRRSAAPAAGSTRSTDASESAPPRTETSEAPPAKLMDVFRAQAQNPEDAARAPAPPPGPTLPPMLGPEAIVSVMQKATPDLLKCLRAEKTRPPSARIVFGLQNTGRVVQVSVLPNVASMTKCLDGKMRQLVFARFLSPRQQATYTLALPEARPATPAKAARPMAGEPASRPAVPGAAAPAKRPPAAPAPSKQPAAPAPRGAPVGR